MKKFTNSFLLILISIALICCSLISGCAFFESCTNSDRKKSDYTFYEIHTVEELYAMESNKCYQLACDIDLEEREWYPLEVKGFNGNGYTIKNCFVNESREFYSGGFFTIVTWLENTVFENIQINITFTETRVEEQGTYYSYNAGGIIVGDVNELVENVIVRRSKAIFNVHTRARLGGIVGEGAVINSTFEESNLVCNLNNSSVNLYLETGGISGYARKNHISGNKVLNSEITVNSGSYVNCGGVIGRYETNGKIENCLSKNNIVNIKASTKNTSRLGGVVGCCDDNAEINNCASINNNILLDTEYGYNIGGVIGKTESKVSNCFSDSNRIEGITASKESNQYAGIGGLCGSSNASITKSVAQNNNIIGSMSTISKGIFAGGFISSVDASVVKCGVYNNTISGGYVDVFTQLNKDLLFDCIICNVGQVSPNCNSVNLLSKEEWVDIINILSLDDNLWTFESGYISLKIAE